MKDHLISSSTVDGVGFNDSAVRLELLVNLLSFAERAAMSRDADSGFPGCRAPTRIRGSRVPVGVLGRNQHAECASRFASVP